MKNKNFLAFTLVEIIVWILIVSIVMIWWFKSLASVTLWKIKLVQQTEMEKQSFYFVEKFFEMVKKWWTIDYEEYFNRKVVWNERSWWHYSKETWFGNFWRSWKPWISWVTNYWEWFYYCVSDDWTKMWTWWCVSSFNSSAIDYLSEPQRYWQYSFQFIDYNSNSSSDLCWPTLLLWDENCDGNIIWDDDDEYLWIWPEVFVWWVDVKELYLISWNKKERTLFRWSVKNDPNKPDIKTCHTISWLWEGCLWTIQYLKLYWEDIWMEHSSNIGDRSYDWVIDTWLIHKDFNNDNIVAWSNDKNYRVDLFPYDINISDFKIFAYPNNDIILNWRNNTMDANISPYIRIQFKLSPSWWARKKMQWTFKKINYSTTINLTTIFSN